MKLKNNLFKYLLLISCWLVIDACVKNRNFDAPEVNCIDEDVEVISIAELKNMYANETMQIQQDVIVEGYINSSDVAGNVFNVLHFQDKPIQPTVGMQIELELRDSHLFFSVGQHIYIKLKGLYLGKSGDVFKIGGVFTSFGNRSVGRLPKSVVFEHIVTSCQTNIGIEPLPIAWSQMNDSLINTLVSINNVEFSEENLGEPYAIRQEETKRLLIDCDDNELVVLNSGYADFQSQPLPSKAGTITGILGKDKDEFHLIIRNLNDVDFTKDRCEDVIDEFTSNNILITEIADPNNNAGARFVELYNSSNNALSLKGWRLVRYTNASSEVSSTVDLSEYTIGAGEFLVLSPNATQFLNVYRFAPDIAVGTNSPADSNGDDNIALIDPFETVVDLFGVVGEDGSGTNHEFEDGRAHRNSNIRNGNATFNPAEWVIYNDTGSEGTINEPQNAPDDFTPGIR